MGCTYRRPAATSMAELQPLEPLDDLEKTSRTALASCRPVSVHDWSWRGVGVGGVMGAILGFFSQAVLDEDADTLMVAALVFAVTLIINLAVSRHFAVSGHKAAVAAVDPPLRCWHERVLELAPRIRTFNEQLAALRKVEEHADAGEVFRTGMLRAFEEDRKRLEGGSKAIHRDAALRELRRVWGTPHVDHLLPHAVWQERPDAQYRIDENVAADAAPPSSGEAPASEPETYDGDYVVIRGHGVHGLT